MVLPKKMWMYFTLREREWWVWDCVGSSPASFLLDGSALGIFFLLALWLKETEAVLPEVGGKSSLGSLLLFWPISALFCLIIQLMLLCRSGWVNHYLRTPSTGRNFYWEFSAFCSFRSDMRVEDINFCWKIHWMASIKVHELHKESCIHKAQLVAYFALCFRPELWETVKH